VLGYIDVRTIVHATEDTEKVLKAVFNALPAELAQVLVFKKTSVTGHHGNPITVLEARIKEKTALDRTFEKLASGLRPLDKELLSSQIQQHVEEGNLYLRLDKQSAYLNELMLCRTDPIHFRIHFKKHGTQEIVEICRNFGLIP
jgi:RNA binding exosome subunit